MSCFELYLALVGYERMSNKEFINPIDKDKITENPHSLEYAHHAGSALIKPEDQGKIKGRALSAMEHQTICDGPQTHQHPCLK